MSECVCGCGCEGVKSLQRGRCIPCLLYSTKLYLDSQINEGMAAMFKDGADGIHNCTYRLHTGHEYAFWLLS